MLPIAHEEVGWHRSLPHPDSLPYLLYPKQEDSGSRPEANITCYY